MRFLVVFLSLTLIPFSYAGALKGVNGVELLAVDGQKIKGGIFKSKEVELADGMHQIVVKYAKRIKDKSMTYSQPHIFSLDIKGDTEISVKHFNSKSQAENAVKRGLTWIVKNEQHTQKIAGSDILSDEGFQLNSNIEKLITDYNKAHSSALPISVDRKSVDLTRGSNQQTKAAQLIEIYRSASKEERKAFRIWLLEQDIK